MWWLPATEGARGVLAELVLLGVLSCQLLVSVLPLAEGAGLVGLCLTAMTLAGTLVRVGLLGRTTLTVCHELSFERTDNDSINSSIKFLALQVHFEKEVALGKPEWYHLPIRAN